MLRLNIAAAIAGSSPSPKSLMNLAKWRSISANSKCVRSVGATFILNSEIGNSSSCSSSSSSSEIRMFHNQNNGAKKLRDNRALFAAENGGASRTKDDDEDESKLRNLSS